MNTALVALVLAALPQPESPDEPRTVYIEDTVWFFELNEVARYNLAKRGWEPGVQAYLFWDALPYPRIVSWRWRHEVEILDEGPNYVVFRDGLRKNDRVVIRRVRFLLSWNSVTFQDVERANAAWWPVDWRRGLTRVE